MKCSNGHIILRRVGDSIPGACPACEEEEYLQEMLRRNPQLSREDIRGLAEDALIIVHEEGSHSPLIARLVEEYSDAEPA